MKEKLPPSFVQRIFQQLGGEADAFLQSYLEPRTFGLRLNPLKLPVNQQAYEELLGEICSMFALEPVAWCPTGFYYAGSTRPGKHPYHQAGLYYIQEPSAMSAVELLAPMPGETVLDLAAAPGGKASHIAGKMQGQGLLIANEIHPGRAKILSENLERMGVSNTVVTQAAPDELSGKFPEMFDRILLDAPCSGEGMFRKDETAIAEWSPQHVEFCAARQMDVISHAVKMLKPGGTLVYSTCTFSEEENEGVVDLLLEREPGLALIRTERLWPHRHRGEGHFAAVLRFAGYGASAQEEPVLPERMSSPAKTQPPAAQAFRPAAPRSGGSGTAWDAVPDPDRSGAGAALLRADSRGRDQAPGDQDYGASRSLDRFGAADGGHSLAASRKARARGAERHHERSRRRGRGKAGRSEGAAFEAYELYKQFAREAGFPIPVPGDGEPLLFGEQLYWLPNDRQRRFSSASLGGLKVLRPGLHLGTVRKNRLEPAHALAMSLPPTSAAHKKAFGQRYRLEPEGEEVLAYWRGESLPCPQEWKGWTVVTVGDFPLGWGKASNGQLKNHLPKGLRLR